MQPKSIEADNGATIVMRVRVEGNPPPEILWIHEPSDKVSIPKKKIIFDQNQSIWTQSLNNQMEYIFFHCV